MNILSKLEGKKTYLIAIANALSAIALYTAGQTDLAELIQALFMSLGGATMRSAIK